MQKIKSLMARQGLTSPQKSMADLSLVENFRISSNKLPTELNLQELEEYRNKLKSQQTAVSKKVADLILEKQPSYVKELERVTSLQTNLQLAAVICITARC
nr:syndetin-like [Oncorhynchus nerka]